MDWYNTSSRRSKKRGRGDPTSDIQTSDIRTSDIRTSSKEKVEQMSDDDDKQKTSQENSPRTFENNQDDTESG